MPTTEHDYQKAMKKQLRKEKLRKAKKNMRPNSGSRGPRQRDWDHLADDEWDAPGFYEDERVMPQGTQERHKIVEEIARHTTVHGEDHGEMEELDLPTGTLTGLVIEAAGEICTVAVNDEHLPCTIRRSLLTQETTFTSPAAAGDQVAVRDNGDGSGVVEQVLPRRSVLARPHRPDQANALRQIVAANIDQVLIVAAWRKPNLWPELIDRYLIAAARNQLEAVICVNKVDLVEDPQELEETLKPYRELGYPVLLTSAESGIGVETLRESLREKLTVFTGLSGVGKSSLLSGIQPGLHLRAKTIGQSRKNRNQGRHTTTIATLYPLAQGGAVIDTPGIRSFGLAFLERRELAAFYPEFDEAAHQCAYHNCSHIHEPECGVQAGVASGAISQLRYENYAKIWASLPG
ncbi:ribosome small subunit-dependent GTPase A [bacterium]|nr:ribosome small subunit-dependent GTPase A [bacterium]MCB2179120.1 ribosome small subunit-dependent GTPase A [bacterium]